MFKSTPKPIKIIFFTFIVLSLLSLISYLVISLNRIGKIEVAVHFAPFSADLQLNNGQKLKNDSINFITPGNYTLNINHDHFESQSQIIEINTDTKYLLGKLVPLDDIGLEISSTHSKDFLKIEAIAGKIASEEGARIKEKHPILNFLPINNNLYSISFKYDEKLEPIVNIKTIPKYQDIAVQKLYTLKNVDPTDYNINFIDLINPYLNPIPNSETQAENFIKASFPDLNFKIKNLGEVEGYYLSSIYSYDFNSDTSFAHYRVILQKDSNTWSFATNPVPILTKHNSPQIPLHLLKQVNQLN